MTEDEWLVARRPDEMLRHMDVECVVSERQLRLFMSACCRRAQKWFTHPCQYDAIEVIDRYADDTATAQEFDEAERAVSTVAQELELDVEDVTEERGDRIEAAFNAAEAISHACQEAEPAAGGPSLFDRGRDVSLYAAQAAYEAARIPGPNDIQSRAQHANKIECHIQAALLRCIFGNPFRPVAFDSRWRSETAVALAAGIYDGRQFDRLPILADAFEDAGCDAVELLNHLRGPGPHARGCWALDAVLGKE